VHPHRGLFQFWGCRLAAAPFDRVPSPARRVTPPPPARHGWRNAAPSHAFGFLHAQRFHTRDASAHVAPTAQTARQLADQTRSTGYPSEKSIPIDEIGEGQKNPRKNLLEGKIGA